MSGVKRIASLFGGGGRRGAVIHPPTSRREDEPGVPLGLGPCAGLPDQTPPASVASAAPSKQKEIAGPPERRSTPVLLWPPEEVEKETQWENERARESEKEKAREKARRKKERQARKQQRRSSKQSSASRGKGRDGVRLSSASDCASKSSDLDPRIVHGKALEHSQWCSPGEVVIICVNIYGVLIAAGDGTVRAVFGVHEVISWGVDGDTFKMQLQTAEPPWLPVLTFLTGFEQGQKLQAGLCSVAEAYISGSATGAFGPQACPRVGEPLPSSWASQERSEFGQGVFLDPQLRDADPSLPSTTASEVEADETLGQMKALMLSASQKDSKEASEALVGQLLAVAVAGIKAGRRRMAAQSQVHWAQSLSAPCPTCTDKDDHKLKEPGKHQEGDLMAKTQELRSQNVRLQKEVEELGSALMSASGEDSGAHLAASRAEIERLEAENRELSAALEESDALVQRQMKSLAEAEARLQGSPGLSANSTFRGNTISPREERSFLLEMAAQLKHGLGALKSDCDALKQDAEVMRRTFPKAVTTLHTQISKAVVAVQDNEAAAIRYAHSESQRRRDLHNQLVDLRGAIRCIARVRPLKEGEDPELKGPGVEQEQGPGKLVKSSLICHDQCDRRYEMDGVLGPQVTQEEVYGEVSPLVQSVLDGYNVCVLAYGQTGAGKTYTMEGTISSPGVATQAMNELFRLAGQRKAEYTVNMSVLEIYNDTLRDQLDENGAALRLDVKQGTDGQLYIPNLTDIEVSSPQEISSLMRTARRNRATFATNLNKHSSRSHSILTVRVVTKCPVTGQHTRGKLQLVDLAGSERMGKLDAKPERLKETTAINKSLSALGDVLFSLGNKAAHIPFRNSKLTYVLQDSLCHGAKVVMLLAVSPALESMKESVNTLNFGTRVRGIELGSAQVFVDARGIAAALEAKAAAAGAAVKASSAGDQQLSSQDSPKSSRVGSKGSSRQHQRASPYKPGRTSLKTLSTSVGSRDSSPYHRAFSR